MPKKKSPGWNLSIRRNFNLVYAILTVTIEKTYEKLKQEHSKTFQNKFIKRTCSALNLNLRERTLEFWHEKKIFKELKQRTESGMLLPQITIRNVHLKERVLVRILARTKNSTWRPSFLMSYRRRYIKN